MVEVIESHDAFAFPLIRRKKFWKKFRQKVNDKFNFNKLASSFKYNAFIFLLMISNCAILVSAQITSDPSYIVVFYFIDEVLLYIYLIDFLIKILGFGFEGYFSDIWNKFDFVLLLISFITELIFLADPSISNFSLDISHTNISNSLKVL